MRHARKDKHIPTELREGFTNPLKQKSEYDLHEHFIDGKQKKWKKVIEWILTIVGWFVLISYIGYFIYGSIAIKAGWYLPEFKVYTREMVLEVQRYFYILLIATLVIALLIMIWKNYNADPFRIELYHKHHLQDKYYHQQRRQVCSVRNAIRIIKEHDRYVLSCKK